MTPDELTDLTQGIICLLCLVALIPIGELRSVWVAAGDAVVMLANSVWLIARARRRNP